MAIPRRLRAEEEPIDGRGAETRTPDLHVPNVARYQLRYTPTESL